jgi:hypothetical protein
MLKVANADKRLKTERDSDFVSPYPILDSARYDL